MRDLRDWKWNAEVPETVDACVHDLFAHIVRDQPNAPAIAAHDGELAYRELDDFSTELAIQVVKHGVQNKRVPAHIEESMWTPVAQLAIIKAGAASVVLGVSQPIERLRTIIDEVHPRLILASVAQEAITRQLSDRPVLVVRTMNLSQLSPASSTNLLPCFPSSAML
ncbi:hypothetical protein GQ44DRAFT_635309 [Phaeosphaeriaceae sp. PMI808]|nr:hypothetical protein GQ44DRAFT_635309 [Phaeosphaeriaceae sp. PMI808]